MSDQDRDRLDDGAEEAAGLPRPGIRRFPLPGSWRLARIAARFDLARAGAGAAFEREMEAGRGFLWLPVLFGLGIVLYFSLPREPSVLALLPLVCGLGAAAWRSRLRAGAFRLLVALPRSPLASRR